MEEMTCLLSVDLHEGLCTFGCSPSLDQYTVNGGILAGRDILTQLRRHPNHL